MKYYTTIEQSRKLAEILPLESADMWWTALNWQETEYYVEVKQDGINQPKKAIPCWSLAALLEQLPYKLCDDDGNSAKLSIYKENDKYQLVYKCRVYDFDDIETDVYEHFVDACVEMVIKLHKLNLLGL